MQGLKHFLLALQFFTRIPVTGALGSWVGYSPAMLRASTAHFPAVGWVVGTVAAGGVYALLCLHLPSAVGVTLVAAVLSTVATVLVTGGFHEDGLADLSDGLGGSYSRERALEIMKDSRVGAFGAMALVLALLAKGGAAGVAGAGVAGQRGAGVVAGACGIAHLASADHTWFATWEMWRQQIQTAGGIKSPARCWPRHWHGAPTAVALAWWALSALPPHWLGGLVQGERWPEVLAAGLLGSGAGWALVHWRLQRRLQGFTGDGPGCSATMSEIGFYLGAALALGQS